MAKKSLALFIRSLPIGCHFSVISFGSRQSVLTFDDKKFANIKIVEYNEKSKEQALEKISLFRADHGGTDINTPLLMAQDLAHSI